MLAQCPDFGKLEEMEAKMMAGAWLQIIDTATGETRMVYPHVMLRPGKIHTKPYDPAQDHTPRDYPPEISARKTRAEFVEFFGVDPSGVDQLHQTQLPNSDDDTVR